jgi:putative CocE/NonD family hydrolase
MRATFMVERDLEVPMRDGTVLRADVYRASVARKSPVLLQRTPYGKGESQIPMALMAAERGYSVVIQDTRGRWASGGENYPLVHEREDGYDTLEWVANQSWCNGLIGMYGSSYLGYTQWAAAAAGHPALKTIIPGFAFRDPHHMTYQGGALNLGVTVSWGLLAQAHMQIERLPGDLPEKAALWEHLIQAVDGLSRGDTFRHLPLGELPLIGKDGITPFFYDVISHPHADAYWKSLAFEYENIRMPVFHIGGWYDVFANSTLQDFVGMQKRAPDDWLRGQQKLLVGPWTHASFENLNGELDFGLEASWIIVLPEELQLQWFDYWLKGEQNGIMDEALVRIFVMGANHWRNEQEWPLARTRYIPYYFHSTGKANSSAGDGWLDARPPQTEPADTFQYNPQNPVSTRGGNLCCWQAALPPGPYDQSDIEKRADVLVYTSAPLANDLEVTGPIRVHLWAASSAPDTDFTAKLVDVYPDGTSINLVDGIQRALYRNDQATSHLEPGRIYAFQIDLGATSNLFKTGHRLRVEISSSNFPRFDRNANTGTTLDSGSKKLNTARQSIFHDSEHPSHIVLPVIPNP